MTPSQAYQIPTCHRELSDGATIHDLLARKHDPDAIREAYRLLNGAEAAQIEEALGFLRMGHTKEALAEMGYASAAILAAQELKEAEG